MGANDPGCNYTEPQRNATVGETHIIRTEH